MQVLPLPSTVLGVESNTDGGYERMLAMPEVHYIKYLRKNRDLNISEIARKTGNNWRTVKKYADGNVCSKDIKSKKKGMGSVYLFYK